MPLIRDTNSKKDPKTEPSTTPALDKVVAASKDSKTGQGKSPTNADIAAAAQDLINKEDAAAKK